MEYLPHMPLHYEHMPESAYAHILRIWVTACIKWWATLTFNETELDMQRIEALWFLQVHRGRFFGDSIVIVTFSNRLTPVIWTDRQIDRQMDKANCLTLLHWMLMLGN